MPHAQTAPIRIETPVPWGAYMPIKQKVLAKLRADLQGAGRGPWLPAAEAMAIVNELSHVEFQWDIAMGPELEALLPTEVDRHLGRFLLGGMIFEEYADLMKSEHWLQPKRASLFVQATTGGGGPKREDESKLFEWLAKCFDLPMLNTWQPTFLHHVLERAKTLRDVPVIVAQLRKSGAVRDYRGWRTQALGEWRSLGGLTQQSLRTMERPLLPGRRHVKLLADSAHARGRYPHIERSVRSLRDAGR